MGDVGGEAAVEREQALKEVEEEEGGASTVARHTGHVRADCSQC